MRLIAYRDEVITRFFYVWGVTAITRRPLNYTIAWLNIPMPQKKRCCRRRRGEGFGEALGIHLYKLSFTVESSTMKTWKLNSSLVRFRWEIPEYFGWQWTTNLCKYPRMAEQGVQSVANINNTDKLSLSLNKEVNTACVTLLDRRAPLKISLLWHKYSTWDTESSIATRPSFSHLRIVSAFRRGSWKIRRNALNQHLEAVFRYIINL